MAVTTAQSSLVWHTKKNITQVDVTVYYTGSPTFQLSNDGDYNGPGTWETVSLSGSGDTITHTFTTTGQFLYWKASVDTADSLDTQKDSANRITAPAIALKVTEAS